MKTSKIYHSPFITGEQFSYYHRPDIMSASLSDIIYFTSEGRRVHLILANTLKSDFFYYKLDDVEAILNEFDNTFVRIHKSYLVNTKYIAGYDRRQLQLVTGEYLSISKHSYYKKLHTYQLLNSKKIRQTS